MENSVIVFQSLYWDFCGNTIFLPIPIGFFVGTSSIYDFSGQYTVDSVFGGTSSYVTFDVSNNPNLVAYGASASLPLEIHGTASTLLSNQPYFDFNKGKKIKVTRVSDSDVLNERYIVEVNDIK